jgi:hypothetical protein
VEGHTLYRKYEMDDTLRRGLTLDECSECEPGNGDRGTDGVYTVGPECPGRSDIVADDATWRAWKKAMKTRTKTTVLEHTQYDAETCEDFTWTKSEGQPRHLLIPRRIVPDGIHLKRGRITIVVTFEPEEKS